MQDYTRLLPAGAQVAVACAPDGWVFCPVKRKEGRQGLHLPKQGRDQSGDDKMKVEPFDSEIRVLNSAEVVSLPSSLLSFSLLFLSFCSLFCHSSL